MKIALVYDAVYPWMKGGGEKALWEIAVGLSGRGHEVHLFGCKFWEGSDRMMRDGIHLHGVARPGAFYREDGKRSWMQPARFAAGLLRALWIERIDSFDVIYCTVFPYLSVFSIWLLRAFSRKKTPWLLAWLEVWGARYWQQYLGGGWKSRLAIWVEQLCAKCSDHHLLISQTQKERLIHFLGVREEQITVIPRGIDFSLFHRPTTQKQLGLVLYTGRLIDYKNVAVILQAWPQVRDHITGACLRVIGSGPDESHLRRLMLELGLKNSVEMIAPIESHEEIAREIVQADILVQPSLREGQGITVIEAMAAETLVIASRSEDSAVSDLITSGVNGWLIDTPTNPDAWAAAIIKALRGSHVAIRAEALEFAKGYDWQSVLLPETEYFLQSLAKSR